VPTSRLEAFSDGVLAIAITLLIIDVKVPDTSGSLSTALGRLWPSYLSFLISFAIIGIIWVNHHMLIARLAVVDRPLLFLNLLLLLTVVWLPFPTALLAHYARHGAQAHAAAAVYGASMTAIGLAFAAMWAYLVRKPGVRAADFSETDAREGLRRTLAGPIGYTATVPLAFVSPVACLVVWAALAVYFIIPTGR